MSSEPILRTGSQRDARDIAEIWHAGWRDGHLGFVPQGLVDARTEESFRVRATERAGEATVAVVAGAVAGFVIVVDNEVEQVYVAARFRRKGVTDALMRDAERQVRENGHAEAWLAVVAGNGRARAFYEHSGWRDEGPFDYAARVENGSISVPCHRYTKRV